MRFTFPLAFLLTVAINGSAQSSTTQAPLATTGIPSPMLYGTTDPVTAGQPCATDPTRMGIPFYNMGAVTSRPIWICNGTAWIQAQAAISGATAAIGGALLALGGTVSGTASVPNAAIGSICLFETSDGSDWPDGVTVSCHVKSVGVATITEKATVLGTPAAKIYNVRIIQ